MEGEVCNGWQGVMVRTQINHTKIRLDKEGRGNASELPMRRVQQVTEQ